MYWTPKVSWAGNSHSFLSLRSAGNSHSDGPLSIYSRKYSGLHFLLLPHFHFQGELNKYWWGLHRRSNVSPFSPFIFIYLTNSLYIVTRQESCPSWLKEDLTNDNNYYQFIVIIIFYLYVLCNHFSRLTQQPRTSEV